MRNHHLFATLALAALIGTTVSASAAQNTSLSNIKRPTLVSNADDETKCTKDGGTIVTKDRKKWCQPKEEKPATPTTPKPPS